MRTRTLSIVRPIRCQLGSASLFIFVVEAARRAGVFLESCLVLELVVGSICVE